MLFVNKCLVNNPLISICIPTFNQENYISETLESILAQETTVSYEIIIADDCSSDNTAKICKEYQQKFPDKIKFISNDQNQGLLTNLFDTLFSNVRGKYIAICAGDDVWINTRKIDIQFNVLNNDNNISAVHTGYNKFYEISNTLKPINSWISPLKKKQGKKGIKEIILENFSSFPVASSMMFRKSTLDKHQTKYSNLIKDKHTPGEGLILYSFCALDGLFKFVPDIMVNYRIREESLSHFIDKDKELSFQIKYRIYHKTLLAQTFLNDLKLVKRINRAFLSLYLSALENNTEKTFFRHYKTYKKENSKNIPVNVRIIILFFSSNNVNKFIFSKTLNLFFWLKNLLVNIKFI
ncbi:glycosyltransferase [Polaribacter sp.]|uniref:glycosyltransferase n=1 Tax=Polaribacter sp. TaxID=1920175 RepID=UPI003F69FCB9